MSQSSPASGTAGAQKAQQLMGKDAPKLQEDIEVGLCVRSNMLCLVAHMALQTPGLARSSFRSSLGSYMPRC